MFYILVKIKKIALIETIVHTPPMIVPKLDIITLEIPNESITSITIDMLTQNWKVYPAQPYYQ